jgi:hypothetical protein
MKDNSAYHIALGSPCGSDGRPSLHRHVIPCICFCYVTMIDFTYWVE